MHQTLGGAHAESAWTAPRPDCPHPEWWHADSAGATEHEVTELVAALVRALQPEIVVETGVLHAHTTVAIGEALARNGHGQLYALEAHRPYAVAAAQLVAELPVHVLAVDSTTWTPPGPIDFAFLDSELDTRWQEIERFWPWLHDRTVLAIHDTAPHHPVRKTLAQFEDKMVLLDLPTPRGITLARLR
jgi:predicted O-methyltransferase YrrM